MSGHTIHNPEKLEFKVSTYAANTYRIGAEGGDWLMAVLHNGEQVEARQIANMRRLVACWNACQGVDTETLEQYPAPFTHIREARDDLLKALRRAVLALAFAAESSPAMRDDYNAVSAAIAKETGEKA